MQFEWEENGWFLRLLLLERLASKLSGSIQEVSFGVQFLKRVVSTAIWDFRSSSQSTTSA